MVFEIIRTIIQNHPAVTSHQHYKTNIFPIYKPNNLVPIPDYLH